MKTELTIEESAKLVELGVDPKLASKCNSTMKVCASGRGIIRLPESRPIFTLSDILSILPKGVIHEGLSIKFRITSWYDEPYFVGYVNQIGEYITPNKEPFSAPELIDSLYQLLIWAIEHNYVNTKDVKK